MSFNPSSTISALHLQQRWRGRFRGLLIVATFAHHYQQTVDAVPVHGLPAGAWRSLPRAALAISAAAVCVRQISDFETLI